MTLVKVGNLPPIENLSDEDMLMIQDREFGKTCRISLGELIKSPLFQNNLIADLVAGSNVSISQQTTPNLEDGSWEEAEEPIDLTVIPEFDPTQKYEIGQVVYTIDGTTTKFWRLLKRIITISSVGGSGGGLTPEQEAKLNSVSMGATKTESSSTNGNIKIDGTETKVFDVAKLIASMIKADVSWTDSYQADDKVSGSSYFYFKPSAFGMKTGDKLKSLTITASTTTGTVPDYDIYCKLLDPDDTSVAVARTGSYRLSPGKSTKLSFLEAPELSPNKFYKMVFCKSGTELTLVHTGLMIHVTEENSDIYYNDNKKHRVILSASYVGDVQRGLDLGGGGSSSGSTSIDTAVLKSMPGYTNSLGDTTFTDLVLLVRALVDQLG